MGSLIERLTHARVIMPPPHLIDTIQFEAVTGSVAYGVSTNLSDCDVCGFAIPPKTMLFPHLAGEIAGFGTPAPRFQ